MQLITGLKKVLLPDASTVSISDTPEAWWSEHNASGFVGLEHIAPDPKNPRRHMNAVKLKELYESIKARGVRESIIVTPRALAPWADVAPEHRDRFFLTVSGHRRGNGARLGCVNAVPIKIVVYANQKDHRMDMSLLNKGRENLSELEEGYEIVDLHSHGWSFAELATSFGFSDVQMVYNRRNLTRLCPEVQKYLLPDVPKRQQFSVHIGGILGAIKPPTPEELSAAFETFDEVVKRREIVPEDDSLESLSHDELRFAMHRLLHAVILRRGLNSVRGAQLVREQTLQLASHSGRHHIQRTQRFTPSKRKEVLENLLKEVCGSAVRDWPQGELPRIFQLTPREDVETFLEKASVAFEMLGDIKKQLAMVRDSKKVTSAEVLRYTKKTTAAPKPEPESTEDNGESDNEPEPTSPTVVPVVPRVATPVVCSNREITVQYWCDHSCRITRNKISAQKYVELWDEGKLKFQKDDEPKPEWLPHRDELVV